MRLANRSTSSSERRGVVLLGVVIVTVILALIAYHYSDRMVAEYNAAQNAHRAAQLRHFADSGVHYAAMMLATPNNISSMLGGNPYDNDDRFKNILVPDFDGSGQAGRFTLVAPIDPDQTSGGGVFRAGVTDETGKININAFMKRDPSGDTLYNMLVKLPNMSADIAAAIVDWVDADTTPRDNGAEDDYYAGQSPPCHCKNGPLDSLDELLLVKGMTRELLYGADLNRNGIADADEGSSSDRGWAAYLTVTSREANRDPTGLQLTNINGDDLTAISEKLGPVIGDSLMKYIILYRQYGPTSSSGTTQSLGSSIAALFRPAAATTTANTVAGDLSSFQPKLTKKPVQKLTSFFDLVATQVSVAGSGKTPTTVYTSPLYDPSTIGLELPLLYQAASLSDDAEIPARINVNTAPREVLACIDAFTDADVQNILAARPKWGNSEPPTPEFQTPTWLASQVALKLQTLRKLETIVTTKSQVYHMQVVGEFDNGNGPTARVEAIVDANYGRPRIVFYRDWSELGRTNLPK